MFRIPNHFIFTDPDPPSLKIYGSRSAITLYLRIRIRHHFMFNVRDPHHFMFYVRDPHHFTFNVRDPHHFMFNVRDLHHFMFNVRDPHPNDQDRSVLQLLLT